MALEAVLARGDDGALELQDGFGAQTGGVSEIARNAADSGDQAIVRVQEQLNLVRQARHGYRSLASATSHASRQSGQ